MVKIPDKLRTIPFERLEFWAEANVRKDMSPIKLAELAENIREVGLIVPLMAKFDKPSGKYLVFSGQRRLAACEKINKKMVECYVFDRISEDDARLLSLSENLYREKMAVDDVAKAAHSLFIKNNKSYKKTADALGVTHNVLRRYLDYYAVPEPVKREADKVGLRKNEVTKIYNKFLKTSKALAVIREFGKIDSRKGRMKLNAAIREASPTDSVNKIKARAKQLLNSQEIKIIIPNDVVSELKKVARQKGQDLSEAIQDIVEDWVTGY